MNYIDLFAGTGGLSEGFLREGFVPVAHIEMVADACKTLQTRASYYYCQENNKMDIYWSYIKKEMSTESFFSQIPESVTKTVINETISRESILRIFQQIDELKGERQIDLVIGGPPCQAYSVIGRARDKQKMKDDPRNFLFTYYIEFLQKYKPKVFIFENVPGLLSAGEGDYLAQMQSSFLEAGYKTNIKISSKNKHIVDVLDASNFGVLQKRKRVIIVGQLLDLHYDFDFNNYQVSTNQLKVIDELFADLPQLKHGEKMDVVEYTTNVPTPYQKQSLIRTDATPFTTWHIARPQNDIDLEIYKQAIEKWLTKRERLKYSELDKRLQKHNNKESFLNRFQVVDPNGCSHTMVAHISCDGHYYIYPSLEQIRSISVREAARIQSFPDDYFFEGSRTSVFKQIGNAVPPMLAQSLAKCLKTHLENVDK